MNLKNSLLKICLGAGIFFPNYLLGNSIASAVSLKFPTNTSTVENILDIDLALKEDLVFISLSDDDTFSLWSEIKTKNLLLKKNLAVQISTYQKQQSELFKSLTASLEQLQFNQKTLNSEENKVVILDRTDYGDIYQGVYDFDTELTNDFQQKPSKIRDNIVDNRQKSAFFPQEILDYTYLSSRSRTDNFDSIDDESSSISPVNTGSTSYISPTSVNSSYYSQPQVSDNAPVSLEDIKAIKSNRIQTSFIKKTPEQIELEEQLQKQREEINKRTQKLKDQLKKQQEKRKQARIKGQQKREKERKKRLEKIAKQQAKSRERNFNF